MKRTEMERTHFIKTWIIIIGVILVITIIWLFHQIMQRIRLRKSYKELSGKVVLITGASSGLGEALAHEFYKRGCRLVICARRKQELERVRSDLIKNHQTVQTYEPVVVPLDVADIDNAPRTLSGILELVGRIDILVNNAGISHRGTILETKPAVDIQIMHVNYFGAIALTKAVLPHMISQRSGHIVQISSIQGLIGLPARSAYCASKHALQAFSDSLRAEVAEHNIYVTITSPGYVRTQISLNALTATGDSYGNMDKATERGQKPADTAEEIVRGVAMKQKEVIIATLVPKLAVFLRKFFPSLYFYVMARRAKSAA